MSSTDNQLVRRQLLAVDAEERNLEAQLRNFAEEAFDDDEVRTLLVRYADQTRSHQSLIADRLSEMPGDIDDLGRSTSLPIGLAVPQTIQTREEQVLRNLLTCFSYATGESAQYESLAVTARASGDQTTAELAKRMQEEESISAEQIWHLLPSRSKIAFNMLTVSEIDPSVETKAVDDRILES